METYEKFKKKKYSSYIVAVLEISISGPEEMMIINLLSRFCNYLGKLNMWINDHFMRLIFRRALTVNWER